jgi:hypothetical protein
MIDFGDDTAGECFNVVRGSHRSPDVRQPLINSTHSSDAGQPHQALVEGLFRWRRTISLTVKLISCVLSIRQAILSLEPRPVRHAKRAFAIIQIASGEVGEHKGAS